MAIEVHSLVFNTHASHLPVDRHLVQLNADSAAIFHWSPLATSTMSAPVHAYDRKDMQFRRTRASGLRLPLFGLGKRSDPACLANLPAQEGVSEPLPPLTGLIAMVLLPGLTCES
jgi:hypothetical protein